MDDIFAPAYPACPTASSWSSSSPPAALGGGGELLEIITNSLGSPQMIWEYSGKNFRIVNFTQCHAHP